MKYFNTITWYVVLAVGGMFDSLAEGNSCGSLETALVTSKYHSRHVENPARDSSLSADLAPNTPTMIYAGSQGRFETIRRNIFA